MWRGGYNTTMPCRRPAVLQVRYRRGRRSQRTETAHKGEGTVDVSRVTVTVTVTVKVTVTVEMVATMAV